MSAKKKQIGPCLFCNYPRWFRTWGRYGFHLAYTHSDQLRKAGVDVWRLSNHGIEVTCFCTHFMRMEAEDFGDHLRAMGGLEAHLLERILSK